MRKKSLRIIALSLTLIIIFPLALVAANWQWNRHHERESLNQQLYRSYNDSPKPLNSFTNFAPKSSSEYRKFEIAGSVKTEITWWRKQSLDGIPGFIALAVYEAGDGSQAVVSLGWSQTAQYISTPKIDRFIGRLRFIKNFDSDPSDLPIGQTNSPATLLLADDKVYFEAIDLELKNLVEIPLPEISSGPHLGYVGQWILISIFAICVYVIAIRNLPKD